MEFTPDGSFLAMIGRRTDDAKSAAALRADTRSSATKSQQQGLSLWAWADTAALPAVPFVSKIDIEM